jgi:hypothetical protein
MEACSSSKAPGKNVGEPFREPSPKCADGESKYGLFKVPHSPPAGLRRNANTSPRHTILTSSPRWKVASKGEAHKLLSLLEEEDEERDSDTPKPESAGRLTYRHSSPRRKAFNSLSVDLAAIEQEEDSRNGSAYLLGKDKDDAFQFIDSGIINLGDFEITEEGLQLPSNVNSPGWNSKHSMKVATFLSFFQINKNLTMFVSTRMI